MTADTPISSLLKQGFTAIRALQELGLRQTFAYAVYKIGLLSGMVERSVQNNMQSAADQVSDSLAQNLFALPKAAELHACLGASGLQSLLAEAGEICAGQVRLFGDVPVPLQLDLPGEKRSWVEYESLTWIEGIGDVKLAWEPARFGWAIILARAYHLSADGRYSAAFWRLTEAFFAANPPGLGLQWTSAQEVSLRLICLVFAWQVFAKAPDSTPERAVNLARWIACHAARIPPTLNYARAQNNNHLLSEAAGLYTAALALPRHPRARHWQTLGWRLLNQGLLDQTDLNGVYCQHSANYHRLMLQLVLWTNTLAKQQGDIYYPSVKQRLSAATYWLAALIDPISGQSPNLGPNDGAYILPFSTCDFNDYRPVLQAAGIAFNSCRAFAAGAWDEMALWYGLSAVNTSECNQEVKLAAYQSPGVLRSSIGGAWAYLRAAHFSGRPGHADQLHLDLWQDGLNLALDAGTYLYNAPPPWDNRLAQAFVHNTVTLEGQDQMQRAGRFLYLQRAQAELTEYLSQPEKDWERLTARHSGYQRLGMLHIRLVEHQRQQWLVHDQIISSRGRVGQSSTARLHWLLTDLPWELEENDAGVMLRLSSPYGPVSLQLSANVKSVSFLLVRAGERLAGSGDVLPVCGWHSPTYGSRLPALSLSLTATGRLPLEFNSAWSLGEQ